MTSRIGPGVGVDVNSGSTLGASASEVKIMKARAAYDRFQMVEDKN